MKTLKELIVLFLVLTLSTFGCEDDETIFDDENQDTTSTDPNDTDNPANPTPGCTDPSWVRMATGYDLSFADVWGSASNDVYAAALGQHLFHYDGSLWNLVEDFEPNCSLDVLEGRSATDIYLGGDDPNCMFHYDGTGWSPVQGPGQGAVRDLALVDGGMFVTNRTSFRDTAWVHDGTGWKLINDEKVRSEGVAAFSLNDAYFLGSEMDNCVEVPADGHTHEQCDEWGLLLHWNGTTLETVLRTQDKFYDGIAVDPASGRIFITGSHYFHEEDKTDHFVLISDDGINFTATVLGHDYEIFSMEAIWVANQNNAFIAVDDGQVFQFDGTAWSLMDTGSTNTYDMGIFGINVTDIFAVGPMGISHYGCDHGDTTETDPEPECVWSPVGEGELINEIEDFWVDADGGLWMSTYTSLHYMESAEDSVTTIWEGDYCEGMSGVGSTVFAVGQEALLLRCTPKGCESLTSPLDVHYDRIHAISPDEAYLVGWTRSNEAIVVRYFEGNLEELPVNYSGRLMDIWGTSLSNLVAVGTAGVITYDGATWSTAVESEFEYIEFRRVDGTANDDIYTVAYNPYLEMYEEKGAVWHFDGTAWSPMTPDPLGSFNDIFARSKDSVFVAGAKLQEVEGWADGLVYHFDGTTWTELPSCFGMTASFLHGNDKDVYAALSEGEIYQYTPADLPQLEPDDDTAELVECDPFAQGDVIEYYASVDSGEYLMVTRPESDWDYEDWRLFFTNESGYFVQREVLEVTRYRDGGTTVIDFVLEEGTATVTFPVNLDDDGTSETQNDPHMAYAGKTFEVKHVDPDVLQKAIPVLCTGISSNAPDSDNDEGCNPLDNGEIIEYYASVGKSETIVVTRPEDDWDYEDFRVFYQASVGLEERVVNNVTRYKDGGTTVIDFILNDSEVTITFPVHLDDEEGIVFDDAYMELGEAVLDVTRFEPSDFDASVHTFICLP